MNQEQKDLALQLAVIESPGYSVLGAELHMENPKVAMRFEGFTAEQVFNMGIKLELEMDAVIEAHYEKKKSFDLSSPESFTSLLFKNNTNHMCKVCGDMHIAESSDDICTSCQENAISITDVPF